MALGCNINLQILQQHRQQYTIFCNGCAVGSCSCSCSGNFRSICGTSCRRNCCYSFSCSGNCISSSINDCSSICSGSFSTFGRISCNSSYNLFSQFSWGKRLPHSLGARDVTLAIVVVVINSNRGRKA